jgi:formate/nitrite transporter
MDRQYLNTTECTEAALNLGLTKTGYADKKTVMLGFMGGIFVAFGCMGYLLLAHSLSPLNLGLGKFLGGMVFPVGLIFTVMIGGSLFTGDSLIGMAWVNGKVSGKDYFRKLVLVWIGNLLGAMFLATVAYHANVFGSEAIRKFVVGIAEHKAHIGAVENITSGFLCNILVAFSVWLSFSAKDATGKIFAMFFPILLFVVSGFQHVVANMFYLTIGYFMDPSAYSIFDILRSFGFVTIGNWLSGGLFIPVIYTILFLKKKKAAVATEAKVSTVK